jgi:hypothetical protein
MAGITVSNGLFPFINPNLDAFTRSRVSELYALFDGKVINDNQPFNWDDQQTSGANTSSTFLANQASVNLSVTENIAGTRVRQTFRRFNYQPGKSQLILMTFNLNIGADGITKRLGYFSSLNGLFLQQKDNVVSVVRRTNVTGNVVDTTVSQSNWNLDKLDGTGRSKVTIDWTKAQLLTIDFEWLGVGRVRFGLYLDGQPVYFHQFLASNVLETVYMSSPNLPLRYEIINDGTGPTNNLTCICSTVSSEGGQEATGFLRAIDSVSDFTLQQGTQYPLINLRLKSTHLDSLIKFITFSAVSNAIARETVKIRLVLNGTINNSANWVDITNSPLQSMLGTVNTTLTGGTILRSITAPAQVFINLPSQEAEILGSTINGVSDIISLVAEPVTANMKVFADLNWREVS